MQAATSPEDRFTALVAQGEALLEQGKKTDAARLARDAYHEAMQAFVRSGDREEKARLRVLMVAANELVRRCG